MTQYIATAIDPAGQEVDRMEFEYDPTTHESYWDGMPEGGLYLTLDAPGVADFARRFIEPGYLEAVGPYIDGEPLVICDENGIAKGLPANTSHFETGEFLRKFGEVLRGTVIIVRPAARP